MGPILSKQYDNTPERHFWQYQKICEITKSNEESNRLIKKYQQKYKYVSLGWIYDKVLFDLNHPDK